MKLLGQGTFGKVVECYDKKLRKYVAIKIIRAVQKYRDASQIEIRVLRTLREKRSNQRQQVHSLARDVQLQEPRLHRVRVVGQERIRFSQGEQVSAFPAIAHLAICQTAHAKCCILASVELGTYGSQTGKHLVGQQRTLDRCDIKEAERKEKACATQHRDQVNRLWLGYLQRRVSFFRCIDTALPCTGDHLVHGLVFPM